MGRTVYVNGEWVDEADAKISVFDRGFLFADAVYEVTSVLQGRLIDFPGHLARLERSLRELDMEMPLSAEAFLALHREIVARNGLEEGLIYLQVSRGAADRDFHYPENVPQTVVMFTQEKALAGAPAAETGIRVITLPDLRWKRRDIKTVQLLYPSMGKMAAQAAGADDAWLVEEDGTVTEGTSNNAWIVTAERKIVTRQLSHDILPGITRAAIMRLAEAEGLAIEERSFTPDEAKAAEEAFITSASTFVYPVVSIDGAPVGGGRPGPLARRLRQLYIEEALKSAL